MGKARQLRKELICGLIAWCVVILIPLMICSENRLSVFLGVATGGLTASGILFHMYRHLEIALDMDVKPARRHMQFAVTQRFVIMAVVLAVSMMYYQWVHPVGTVLGLFGIKITALFYPKYHTLFVKWHEGREKQGCSS